ncbi:MAG: serine/threonine protein kinase [Planctomycetes bacterium]|nr:serine/threonine protein kinase [Planctomycetota bacterium]
MGEGANSAIYRARCMRTGKDYAVKIVKVRKPEDNSFLELLKAEHAIGSTLRHPILREIYELRLMRQRLRVRGGILFMEYVDAIAMSDKEFSRPMIDVLQLMREVAHGLHAMHMAGYVHADLKPNNILVTREDTVKLIDLGQSSVMHEAKPRVQGSIDFMAPEQAQRGVLDQRTDVFGLGAALHRVFTGEPVATEMNQTVNLHSQSLVGKRVSEIRDRQDVELPTCISRLIDDCCQADPDGRIADMPTVVERINLAIAILSKQQPQDSASRKQTKKVRESKKTNESDALDDTILQELGLENRDDSLDLDEFQPDEE